MKNKAFGSLIRNRRLEMKIGLREFAKKVKLSPTFISKIENGIEKSISECSVKRIAKALELNSSYLMLKLGKIPEEYKQGIMDSPRKLCLFLINNYEEES